MSAVRRQAACDASVAEQLRHNAFATAHHAAIDRLCLNMMAGNFTLEGVGETYTDTLAIERKLQEQGA